MGVHVNKKNYSGIRIEHVGINCLLLSCSNCKITVHWHPGSFSTTGPSWALPPPALTAAPSQQRCSTMSPTIEAELKDWSKVDNFDLYLFISLGDTQFICPTVCYYPQVTETPLKHCLFSQQASSVELSQLETDLLRVFSTCGQLENLYCVPINDVSRGLVLLYCLGGYTPGLEYNFTLLVTECMR